MKKIVMSSMCLILSSLSLSSFAGGAPTIGPIFLSNETDRRITCSQSGLETVIEPHTSAQMQLKGSDNVSCTDISTNKNNKRSEVSRAAVVRNDSQTRAITINPMQQKYDLNKGKVTVRFTIDQAGRLSVSNQ